MAGTGDAGDPVLSALLAAVAARDLAAIEGLLADRVTWHGDGAGGGCHTRADVLAWIAPLLQGPAAPVVEVRRRAGDQVLLEVAPAGGEPSHMLVTFAADGRVERIIGATDAAVAERDMRLRAGGAAVAPAPAPAGTAAVSGLVPFAHVADVARSIAFYELLGFEVADTFAPGGRLAWAFLRSADAALMLARAEIPVDAGAQAVLFYLYTRDLAALRDRLVTAGAGPGQICDGRPGPREELRIDDPDGYCLMIAQIDEPPAPPR